VVPALLIIYVVYSNRRKIKGLQNLHITPLKYFTIRPTKPGVDKNLSTITLILQQNKFQLCFLIIFGINVRPL
jgi:hypothetical protein